MRGSADGGRNAIAGFVYQVLASHGLVATIVEHPTYSSDGSEAQGEVLFGMRPDAAFGEEVDDLLIRGPILNGRCQQDIVALVQCKYTGVGNELAHADLEEILLKLVGNSKGYPDDQVRFYYLLTNRPLNKALTGQFGDTEFATRYGPVRLVGDWPGPNGEVLTILSLTADGAIEELRRWSQAYGLDAARFEAGLDKLVGAYVRRASASCPVDVSFATVRRHIIGDGAERARPLLGTVVREASVAAIRGGLHHLPVDSIPCYRSARRDLESRLSDGVVRVTGDGGIGKSAFVHQWAADRVGSDTGHPFTLVFTCDGTTQPSVEGVLETVRALTRLPKAIIPTENTFDAVEEFAERVQAARGGDVVGPALCLVVDGIDEMWTRGREPDGLAYLVRVLAEKARDRRSAGKVPLVCLVLVVRSLADTDERNRRIRDWLRLPEAEVLPEVGLRGINQSDIEQALPWLSHIDGQRSRDPDGGESWLAHNDDRAVSWPDWLRYPFMLSRLTELSEPQQRAALRGDDHALAEVAAPFVKWFVEQYVRRRPTGAPLEPKVRRSLRACALHTTGDGPFTLADDSSAHCEQGLDADGLYHEALECGLIHEPSRSERWQWRFLFVARYLAEQGSSDE